MSFRINARPAKILAPGKKPSRVPSRYQPFRRGKGFAYVGGALCLDLVNTMQSGTDRIPDFALFVEWLQGAGVFSDIPVTGATWNWPEAVQEETLRQVRALREALRESVAAIIGDQPVPPAILGLVNPILNRRPDQELVLRATGKLAWLTRPRTEQPFDLLYPVVESAADLLAGTNRDFIRRCEHPACSMVFVDLGSCRHRRCCAGTPCGRAMRKAVVKANGRKPDSKPPRVKDQN